MNILTPNDASNWERWRYYIHFGNTPADWTIQHTLRPNIADCLEESNHAHIEKRFEPFFAEGTAEKIQESHPCTPLYGIAFRCVMPDGSLSPEALVWNDMAERFADYPVLDEDDWSQREADEQWRQCKEYCGDLADTVSVLFSDTWEGEHVDFDERQLEYARLYESLLPLSWDDERWLCNEIAKEYRRC
jgi:hypothetical protein